MLLLQGLLISSLSVVGFAMPTVGQLSKRTGTEVGWTVANLTRDCSDSFCNYEFEIDFGAGKAWEPCTLQDTGYSPSSHSFYAMPCAENADHLISWGYNSQYGFAVMTIVRYGQDAFFGWNDVNARTSFPDVGPNEVYTIGEN